MISDSDARAIQKLVQEKFQEVKLAKYHVTIQPLTDKKSPHFQVLLSGQSTFKIYVDDTGTLTTAGLAIERRTTHFSRGKPKISSQSWDYNIKVSAADPECAHKILGTYAKWKAHKILYADQFRAEINHQVERLKGLVAFMETVSPGSGKPLKTRIWKVRHELTMAARRMDELDREIKGFLGI